MPRYQDIVKEYGFADKEQLMDFSSAYFEGEKAAQTKFIGHRLSPPWFH
jgi:hypothetical protein